MNTINRGLFTLGPPLGLIDQPQIPELGGTLQAVIDARIDALLTASRVVSGSGSLPPNGPLNLVTVPAGRNWYVLGGVVRSAPTSGGPILFRVSIRRADASEVWCWGSNAQDVAAFTTFFYAAPLRTSVPLGVCPLVMRPGDSISAIGYTSAAGFACTADGNFLVADLAGGTG